jgi:hypothetical protein
MNRADGIRVVHDLALMALGAGIALVVLGILTIHEQRTRTRKLRRSVDAMRHVSEQVRPEPRRPLSARHLVSDIQSRREGAKHAASADRRANH